MNCKYDDLLNMLICSIKIEMQVFCFCCNIDIQTILTTNLTINIQVINTIIIQHLLQITKKTLTNLLQITKNNQIAKKGKR